MLNFPTDSKPAVTKEVKMKGFAQAVRWLDEWLDGLAWNLSSRLSEESFRRIQESLLATFVLFPFLPLGGLLAISALGLFFGLAIIVPFVGVFALGLYASSAFESVMRERGWRIYNI